MNPDFDVIVVGSGFGGGVAALRLVEKGYSVAVLEAGRRWASADFPKTNWNLRRALWFPKLGMRGIQRIRLLPNVLVLSGAGVGGGSLVWANVCYQPPSDFFAHPGWSRITDWEAELAPHFEQARRMLGVQTNPSSTPADQVLAGIASRLGVATSHQPTPVAVYFGEPGKAVADPYFGGAGPTRTGCIECGGCMIGCRYDAKNSVEHNYLYLAERGGAVVYPEQEVYRLRSVAGGYQLQARRPGAWIRHRYRTYSARQVVLAAGAIGTTQLLLAMRDEGTLPDLSPRLGCDLRTNSEAIMGAVARHRRVDYSRGVAITSSIQADSNTQIQVVRYPKAANALGLLATIPVEKVGRTPRQLRFIAQVIRHPLRFLRSLSVRHWSERSVILLVMQSIDNSLRLARARWGRLTTRPGEGEPSPRYLPIAHQSAAIAAELMDGDAMGSLSEALVDVGVSAHPIGGAVIADSPQRGVIDGFHRVFGCPGLHVMDGAALPANLGVNPSLTITALAERAAALWPNRDEADLRPPLGSPYQRQALVVPLHPVVPANAPAALGWATQLSP